MASRKARVSSVEENCFWRRPSRAPVSVSLVRSVTAAPPQRRRLGRASAMTQHNTAREGRRWVCAALDPTYTLSSLHHLGHDEEMVLAGRGGGDHVVGDAA